MAGFREGGFIESDTLVPIPEAGQLRLRGEISCKGDILICVEKTMEVISGAGDDAYVQTVLYAYNASVRGYENIFRYDNAHRHDDHPDRHHMHSFDWRTGEELEVVHVGVDGWPTLGEFIEKVEEWYYAHREELPNPDAFAKLELRSNPSLATAT